MPAVLPGHAAGLTWRRVAGATPPAAPAVAPTVAWIDRLRWLALAFVPSSLLLGVTTHISTDVAAVPLLWVVPLALYLLTFTAAFASPPPLSRRWPARLVAPAIAAAVIALVLGVDWRAGLAVHLAAFAVIATAFHRELADRRPMAADLTQFFLVVSVGGALGGLFNALVAPRLFVDVAEYPLVLALAAALRPSPGWRDGGAEAAPLVLGIPAFVFVVLTGAWSFGLGAPDTFAAGVTGYWLLAAAVLAVTNRRPAFALAVAAAVAADLALPTLNDGRVIFAARSFFGVHRVVAVADGSVHQLLHGTTLHGVQRMTADGCEPTSYYHPDGPIGQLFGSGRLAADRVAIVGLGAGGLACYRPAGAVWTFLEIDPLVERIARDPTLFSFLARAAGEVRVVIGDGRRGLADMTPASLDLVIADAFSSDAVPVHLLTREFVRLALDRLRPGGVAVFHISNRYLQLGPVLARAAADLDVAAVEQALAPTATSAVPSRWMAIGDADAVARVTAAAGWPPATPGPRAWTDDHSNILDVLSLRP
ncbi:MAG: spermidine synthase [Vicinamibacterales bacterium]